MIQRQSTTFFKEQKLKEATKQPKSRSARKSWMLRQEEREQLAKDIMKDMAALNSHKCQQSSPNLHNHERDLHDTIHKVYGKHIDRKSLMNFIKKNHSGSCFIDLESYEDQEIGASVRFN